MLYFCLYSFSDVFFYFVFSFVFIFLVLIKSSGAAFTHPVHFLTSKNKKKKKKNTVRCYTLFVSFCNVFILRKKRNTQYAKTRKKSDTLWVRIGQIYSKYIYTYIYCIYVRFR